MVQMTHFQELQWNSISYSCL